MKNKNLKLSLNLSLEVLLYIASSIVFNPTFQTYINRTLHSNFFEILSQSAVKNMRQLKLSTPKFQSETTKIRYSNVEVLGEVHKLTKSFQYEPEKAKRFKHNHYNRKSFHASCRDNDGQHKMGTSPANLTRNVFLPPSLKL